LNYVRTIEFQKDMLKQLKPVFTLVLNFRIDLPFLLLIMVMAAVSSCYYDNEEDLFPENGGGCDTSQVTYSLSIVPIIRDNCLTCHGNTAAPIFGSNIKLEDYSGIKAKVDEHRLLGAISHQSGYVAMPLNDSKLDDCKINTIRSWINAGAPDN